MQERVGWFYAAISSSSSTPPFLLFTASFFFPLHVLFMILRILLWIHLVLWPCMAYTAVGRFGHSAVLVNDR